MKASDFKVELVQWNDAQSVDHWESLDDLKAEVCPNIFSLGFVIKETKDVLMMALNIDEANEKLSCVMLIPKKMIVKRIKINAKTNKGGPNTSGRKW